MQPTQMQCPSPCFHHLNYMASISNMFHKGVCCQFWPTLLKISINLCLTVNKLLQAKVWPAPASNAADEQQFSPTQVRRPWFSRVSQVTATSPGKGEKSSNTSLNTIWFCNFHAEECSSVSRSIKGISFRTEIKQNEVKLSAKVKGVMTPKLEETPQ